MSIVSFEFENREIGWRLQKTHFSPFNLLVGTSGVGKSRVLRALRTVRNVVIKGARANGCSWSLELDIEKHIYQWKASVSLIPGMVSDDTLFGEEDDDAGRNGVGPPIFETETIVLDGKELVFRKQDEGIFRFNNSSLPKLKDSESVISLLEKEDVISPLYLNIKRFIFSNKGDDDFIFPLPAHNTKKYSSFLELQASVDRYFLYRAWIMQEQFLENFKEISNRFVDIFSTIEDLKLISLNEIEGVLVPPWFSRDSVTLAIKEKGVKGWIPAKRLSSGMIQTLTHLLELALAPKDSVFFFDELENSLGVNCLPQVVDAMRERMGEVQFILTSHHPYVINNIPYESWKIVTRKGSEVTVRDASEINALQTKSAQDRFFLLLNSPEYEEGIQ
ncbi:MAG: ATP-binding protein [Magnetococcus sp. DMHC-6]